MSTSREVRNEESDLVEELLGLFGPLRLRHCPLTPTPTQEAFLLLREREAFTGGGAGGGKSVVLLMGRCNTAMFPDTTR